MARLSRRSLLAAGAAGLLFAGVHSSLPAADKPGPNDKLRIAGVGCNGQANYDLGNVTSEAIVAICDVDENSLNKRAAEQNKDARKYRDFRVMLEKEADKIDAVVVATPDHIHAPAAAMALKLGKHVYCEKPLTHTVYEARRLAELAKEHKCVTQLGSQIHAGDNYRRVVELIQAGAIGKVSEVHVFVNVNYSGAKFTTDKQCPSYLDWDLWLGPATERPYSEGPHPFNWRRYWDYGTGGLGDFGCHYGDLVHWALDLRHPTKITAQGPPVDPVSCPPWVIVEYQYPARGERPPVKYTWYDGGKRPAILDTLKRKDGSPLKWGNGQLFIGDQGMLISDYGQHLLLPEEKFVDFKRPAATIPSSIGHHKEWINAIKNGGPTTCNFDYSGALTEAVLLGTVAYRSGESIEWDGAACKVTNSPKAQQFVHKEYRKGWTLG